MRSVNIFFTEPRCEQFNDKIGVMGMIKMRRFGLGGFCKRAIAFMVMLCLLLSDMVVFKVEAATFSYKWIGSASSSGSFKFSDGTTDSAGYGYCCT